MSDIVMTTERLTLRRFTHEDAAFVLRLLNEPSFKAFIGDKGVRDLDDAHGYIEKVPLASYADYGYGGYQVQRSDDGTTVGMCGLYQRSNLDHPDLGFALLEDHFGNGFATESSLGVMRYARDELRLPMLAAVVDPENVRSIALIRKLGFRSSGVYRMPGDEKELRYFVHRFGSSA